MPATLRRRIAAAFMGLAIAGPAAAAPPVWSAPPSVAVAHEDVAFQSAGVTLSGTLHRPVGPGPYPAVVVAHGASTPLRDAPLYRHLVEMLPPLGVAVFVYDRRGSGRSGGDLAASDYALLADDAVAALRALKADRRIDPRRVGVWGLSQGGWLALLAAARSPDVRFVVSISAPLVTPDVQMMFYSANALRAAGYGEADIAQMQAARQAVDDYMRGRGDRAEAQRQVDAVKTKPWFPLLYMSDTVADREVSRWRREIEHEPLATLEAVKVDALVIYGAADPVVPVETSMARLKPLVAARPNLTAAVVAGADHEMATTIDLKSQLDPAQAADHAPDSAAYFGLLASWLTERGIARTGR